MKVYLSALAELKLELLIEYLASEWGKSSKVKFLNKLETTIDRISNFPDSNPKSNELGGIYKCVVSKQTSLVYRIKNDEVEIITIFDNRQDPKKINQYTMPAILGHQSIFLPVAFQANCVYIAF
jgi:plasmid stabilization system protein ParE